MVELLLRKSVESLGRVGEIVDVKPGFARNYLLPMGLAIPVTEANKKLIAKMREAEAAEEAARVGTLKELGAQIAETSFTVEGRAGDDGKLFGSVNAAQIVAALAEKGFKIEERQVRLEAPLKEIGVFDVPVRLHADVEIIAKVWVVEVKPTS